MANDKSKRGRRSPMSDAHKEALAEGRTEGRAVRRYLDWLEFYRPKRGRRVDHAAKIAEIDAQLDSADPIKKLSLVQARIDHEKAMNAGAGSSDEEMAEILANFVKYAKPYGERKGITYTAWRSVGVPAAVLREAGIGRSN